MKTNYEIRYAAHPEDAKKLWHSKDTTGFLNRKKYFRTMR